MKAPVGEYLKERNDCYLYFNKKTPCISLYCKLVPVQYREYKYMYALLIIMTSLGKLIILHEGKM